MHAAFVSIDACTGHKTIQPGCDSELLLRQPFSLSGLLETFRKDSQWADFLGHDSNRAGEIPTRFVTLPCLRYYELRSMGRNPYPAGVTPMPLQLVLDEHDRVSQTFSRRARQALAT